jgi:putative membrane protein
MTRNLILAAGLAAAVALSMTAAQAQSADKASQKFMTNAMEGDYAEIDVGKLAQEKGTTQAVKDFGAKLVADHGKNLSMAKQVASQVGVKDPGGASISDKAEYLKLKVMSGATFDRTFAKDMVSDHQKEIKDFQQQAAKTGPTADFAKQTLPTLQDHLQIAQSLTQQTTGSK